MANVRNYSENVPNISWERFNHWDEYLTSVDWQRFCTFTTGYPLSLDSARRLMERFTDRIVNRIFNDLDTIKFFWCSELHRTRDSYHCHGLLQYDPDIEKSFDVLPVLNESYQIVTGGRNTGKTHRAQFRRYNSNQHAARYCAKYLTDKYHDFDLVEV